MGIIDLCIQLKPLQEDWEPAYEDRIYAVESNHIGYVVDPFMVKKNRDILFYCPSAVQIVDRIKEEELKGAWEIARVQISRLNKPDSDQFESVLIRAYALKKYNMVWKKGQWEKLTIIQALWAHLGGLIWTWK